jgi:hypothetical protein
MLGNSYYDILEKLTRKVLPAFGTNTIEVYASVPVYLVESMNPKSIPPIPFCTRIVVNTGSGEFSKFLTAIESYGLISTHLQEIP